MGRRAVARSFVALALVVALAALGVAAFGFVREAFPAGSGIVNACYSYGGPQP